MIEGSLRDAALADVFSVIATGQKTGVLTVVRNDVRSRLYFEAGRLQYAHIAPGVQLGEILVRLDLVTSREVQDLLRAQKDERSGSSLGWAAVQSELVSEKDLTRALRLQASEVLSELLVWKTGTFEFSERPVDATQVPVNPGFDANMLLIEVASRLAEWRDGNAEPGTVYLRAGDPTKTALPDGGWEVLGYVDGKRSARSIAAELDLPPKRVYRILFELASLGVIRSLDLNVDEPIVLVVSPSPTLSRLIRLALERARCAGVTVEGLDDASAWLHEHLPNAVVLDDDSDAGWQFARAVKAMQGRSHVPLLMLVDGAPQGGLLARLRRPRIALLEKPFHEIDFQQTVSRLLGKNLL